MLDLTTVLFIAVPIALLIGGIALDRWHQRYAWRQASRSAAEYMRRRNGGQ